MNFIFNRFNIISYNRRIPMANEKGSVLITSILLLLVLTMVGIFALNSSVFELQIAGNQQRYQNDFNIAEGGANKEGSRVGYAGVNGLCTWYEIADPETYNTPLYPSTLANYDPSGNDMPVPGTFPNDFDADDTDYWPRQNLMANIANDIYDYAYLVTYLYPDVPPKGMDATKFSSYKFRLNGQRQVVIEMGGIKVGVKNPL